MIQYNSSKKER